MSEAKRAKVKSGARKVKSEEKRKMAENDIVCHSFCSIFVYYNLCAFLKNFLCPFPFRSYLLVPSSSSIIYSAYVFVFIDASGKVFAIPIQFFTTHLDAEWVKNLVHHFVHYSHDRHFQQCLLGEEEEDKEEWTQIRSERRQ